MSLRYKNLVPPFSWALRERLREGYRLADLKSDVMAGLIVGMVAIPLGMALAIATGVPPQHGLYTVIIGGGVVALLGGSRCQVTGPTAAFVVILAPIVTKFGLSGLLVSGFLAGLILVAMGMARMGRLIEFIPHPVTTGFTSGIAVVIATIQVKDFFGLTIPRQHEHYVERVSDFIAARGTWSPVELTVAAGTLALLVVWPRINRKVPAPLIALSLVTLLTLVLQKLVPSFGVATIGTRFAQGIPQSLPAFHLPWQTLDWDTLRQLLPSAFAIAMLGAIESLLSAVVADGMAHTEHDPDAELIALGIGNILCPFFGGIAATGAIARTAANIRFGARSPIAAVVHALFTLLVILVFAPYVSYFPMAALAALLVFVAYNMSEVRHFAHIVKVAPWADVAVLLICFLLTVLFDMVTGVSVGVVLAAMLFMRSMSAVTSGKLAGSAHHHHGTLPKGALLYEINGPLFFGAADRAIEELDSLDSADGESKIVIFSLEDVPMMDVTGLVAFESAIQDLLAHGRRVILCGVQRQPRKLLVRSGLLKDRDKVSVCSTVPEAIESARKLLA